MLALQKIDKCYPTLKGFRAITLDFFPFSFLPLPPFFFSSGALRRGSGETGRTDGGDNGRAAVRVPSCRAPMAMVAAGGRELKKEVTVSGGRRQCIGRRKVQRKKNQDVRRT